MGKDQIIYLPVKDLKPYKNNPRKNAGAVDAVAASIKEYGFRSPIIIDEHNTIINGHTRFKAAKQLGMEEVPCVKVTDLSEEQIRQYRLIDNKTAELADWDADLLESELFGMDFSGLEFEFDFTDDLKKRKSWQEIKKRCDLKDKTAIHKANGSYYQSLFKIGTEGKLLEDLKAEENVNMFADTAMQFISTALGTNLKEADWCLVTTPRRRHLEGFHFSTAICQQLAIGLEIPFYPDAITAPNRHRIQPVFSLKKNPKERNVILYDDIITTGATWKASRDLLTASGHNVFTVISINNN